MTKVDWGCWRELMEWYREEELTFAGDEGTQLLIYLHAHSMRQKPGILQRLESLQY